jgi:hypothetical protein
MLRAVRLILIFGVLHISLYIFGQQEYPVTKSFNGKIKSIRETKYSVPKPDISQNKEFIILDARYHYNKFGNITKSYFYSADTLFSYVQFTYNLSNIIKESVELNPDQTPYLKIKYSSNDKGIVTKESYIRDFQKSYDLQRQSINVEYEKYYNNLFTIVQYKNDVKGNVIEKRHFSNDNRLLFKYLYKYDYKHNLVEIKFYNNSGKLSWRKKMIYSPQNQMTSSKLYKSNRIAQSSKFDYKLDPHENWIECIETRTIYNNFFADDINNNTLITIRKIEYW